MADYWIKGDDGEEYGPVNPTELAEWVRENRAGVDTPVREDGASEWKVWQDYPELMTLSAEVVAGSLFPGQPHLHLAPVYLRLGAFIFDAMSIFLMLVILMAFVMPPSLQQAFAPPESAHTMKDILDHFEKIWHHSQQQAPSHAEVFMMFCGLMTYVLYFTYFHAKSGQTPGKRLFHIRVVDAQGLTISYWKSFVRTFAAYLSQQFGCIGHFLAFVTPHRQAFHDLVAKTYVIRQK